MKDKAKIKGCLKVKVLELSSEGQDKFNELKAKYGKDRKKIPEYIVLREALYEGFGHIKRHPQTWFEKILGIPGRLMMMENHNIVTDQGDALIADLMSETPTQTKVDNTNGHITVGTGWTGTTPKSNETVNTPTDSPEVMDATYPKNTGAFGAANDNKVEYRATFEAGDLDATDIDEAGLGNHATEATGDNLAYGQITPSVTVGLSDTLQVDWELTILGA